MKLVIAKRNFDDLFFEFVERKGEGHPDTLSDNLAEHLSAQYSKYTLKKFGAILHHNFDKVGLLGGASSVKFGDGRLVKPIRVLLNGRASTRFGTTSISVRDLLVSWATEFLCARLPLKDPSRDLEFHYNLSTQSSPGKTEETCNLEESARNYWFEPRYLSDIPELERLFANDTSMGVGFFPYSRLESLVLEIEKTLTTEFKKDHPWIGTDIKIMGFRHAEDYELTMCIPQIADLVLSIGGYKRNVEILRKAVTEILIRNGVKNYNLNINTRDDYESGEIYLTATGSSIESGDEGLVGRGNRIQGFISPMRLMSMEGAAGKNPVYHIGKIYYVSAQKISESIYNTFGIRNEIVLVSQSGRDLLDPWLIFAHLPEGFKETEQVESHIRSEIKKIPELTSAIINGHISIC